MGPGRVIPITEYINCILKPHFEATFLQRFAKQERGFGIKCPLDPHRRSGGAERNRNLGYVHCVNGPHDAVVLSL